MMLTDGVLLMQDSNSDGGILLINKSLRKILHPEMEEGQEKVLTDVYRSNTFAPGTFKD